ncbi:MAG: carboxylating nicotinate-nucleotide diphosphorylase [Planctomycetota bacterium]|nr:MAG: carboxylating nicotinate-nucleotide diphosphorylase [Planctomycetota bacterium]
MTTEARTDYRIDWNALTLPQLFDELARADAVIAIERALAEDLGAAGISGDVTSAVTIAPTARGRARVVSRSSGVVAGLRVAEIIAQRAGLTLTVHVDDGSRVERGTRIASLEGPLVSLLAHERTMLNFLTLLSGNATLAAQFVDAVHPSRAAICDTRKTIPGLRTLQKYASRCGGATLHRIGLYDAVLIKDNHLGSFEAAELAERVRAASMQARAQRTIAFVECEVDSLAQFDRLLTLEVGVLDMVLLDNMEPAMLSEAVRRRDARAPHLLLEASGGVRLDTVRRIAASGVDRISVGAITHSANALDIGLDMDASLSGA